MMIGKILQHIKLLFGANNGIHDRQIIDGFEDKCKNKIKNKDKIKRKLILKL